MKTWTFLLAILICHALFGQPAINAQHSETEARHPSEEYDDDFDDEEYDDYEDEELVDEEEEFDPTPSRQTLSVLLPVEALPAPGVAPTVAKFSYKAGTIEYLFEFELKGHELTVRHFQTSQMGFPTNKNQKVPSEVEDRISFNLNGIGVAVSSELFMGRDTATFYIQQPVYSLSIEVMGTGPGVRFNKMRSRLNNQAPMRVKSGDAFYATHSFGTGTTAYKVLDKIENPEKEGDIPEGFEYFMVQSRNGETLVLAVAEETNEGAMKFLDELVAKQSENANSEGNRVVATFTPPPIGLISYGKNYAILRNPALNMMMQKTALARAASQRPSVNSCTQIFQADTTQFN